MVERINFTGEDDDDDEDSSERTNRGRGYEFLKADKRREEAKKIAESLEKSPLFGEKKAEKQEFEPKHLKKVEAAPETEAPLEGLGEEEQQEIVQELAATRKAEVQQELAAADPDSPEATEAAEVIEVLEAIEASGEIDAEPQEETVEEPSDEALPLEEEAEISFADEPSDEEDDATQPAQPQSQATTSSSSSTTQPIVPGHQPPPPPMPPGPPGPGPGPNVWPVTPQPMRSPAMNAQQRNPNMAANPTMFTSAEMAEAEQQAGARGFIVGGIIGYLIGRRRGRIRTEKRLMPVQQKLEKEVKNLQEQLVAREMKVRTLAFERLPEQQRVPRVRTPEAPTSRPASEEPVRIERLGKAVVGAEAPAAAKPELRNITPEHIKDMGRNELLQLSEKVVVEGASLRQIYEQHMIGERGLRHLITEYLQGRDIRKDLRNEMVEREIDFERDPILRDAAYHTTGGGTANTSLQQLLEKVGASATPDDALLPVAKLQAAAKEEAIMRKKRRRLIADTAMITLIVILAAAVTALLLER